MSFPTTAIPSSNSTSTQKASKDQLQRALSHCPTRHSLHSNTLSQAAVIKLLGIGSEPFAGDDEAEEEEEHPFHRAAFRTSRRRITSLSLANFNALEIIQLLEYFEHLRELNLSGQRFGDSNGDGLADVVCRRKLERLGIDKSRLVPTDYAALDLEWSKADWSSSSALTSFYFNAETLMANDRDFLDALGRQAPVLEFLGLNIAEGWDDPKTVLEALNIPHLQALHLQGFREAVLAVAGLFRRSAFESFTSRSTTLLSSPPTLPSSSYSINTHRLAGRCPSAIWYPPNLDPR